MLDCDDAHTGPDVGPLVKRRSGPDAVVHRWRRCWSSGASGGRFEHKFEDPPREPPQAPLADADADAGSGWAVPGVPRPVDPAGPSTPMQSLHDLVEQLARRPVSALSGPQVLAETTAAFAGVQRLQAVALGGDREPL